MEVAIIEVVKNNALQALWNCNDLLAEFSRGRANDPYKRPLSAKVVGNAAKSSISGRHLIFKSSQADFYLKHQASRTAAPEKTILG